MSTTSLLVQSLPVLAQGAVLTVKFAVLSMVFGLLGAVVLAMMGIRQSEALEGFERIWVNALAWLARAYVSLMRGTPLLVQIFVIYYGLPSLGISLDPTPAGVIALSANVAAYMSESMRGAINGIARGQWLAAYSLGLSWGQTLRYVIGPQALRIAVPSLSNSLISLIKDTSLVSVITVTELLRSAQEMIAATYQPLPLYLAAAAVYWVLCQILEWVQRWYEKRLSLPARHRANRRHRRAARARPALPCPVIRPDSARRARRAPHRSSRSSAANGRA
ncbi:L-cystine transport system permease protein YecS [Burkholderia pseudomultivorans]|uniref:L-cystine transport system permease protein YecS n=3 Tax=Burkholderia cepacia complex TaxID=87882 RepID=A0ABU2E054_9BURK|nr:L-cystine transport system permease protein YecS [Burkholderia pseudomultivorans]MDR8734285.1 L-cystine transport system permease protein YecS [Burkholderia pseudomultivorans]MDR8744490.1 L-cystine transport system permease protein YecS [Burkholderia pseudomultivorans]MDR8753227.1 L-cystine transport system permease protein YecS [Burkholderia pseudomultivorans]MDR8778842.1 L-cystine transport system permease protein YecS [Burkholderia pseudomultivorans]